MTAAAAAPLPAAPKQVSTAAIVVVAAAVVNALSGLSTLLEVDRVRTGVARTASRQGIEAGSLEAVVAAVFAVVVVGSLLYSAALVGLVLLLRRGRTRARPVLLGLSVLSVLGLLVSDEAALAVVLLLAIGDVTLVQRPVSEWVRAVRASRG